VPIARGVEKCMARPCLRCSLSQYQLTWHRADKTHPNLTSPLEEEKCAATMTYVNMFRQRTALFDLRHTAAKIFADTLDAHARKEFTESASIKRSGGSQTNH
jgi:hypothetical protein